MFGSNILEIVIGLVFIYLLYSLLATTIKEGVASILNLRARMLEKAIKRMLDDGINEPHSIWEWIGARLKTVWNFISRSITFLTHGIKLPEFTNDKLLVKKFYDNPGIKYLGENRWHKKPSYISAECFSKAVVDVLKDLGSDANLTQSNTDKIASGISKIDKLDETKKLIQSLLEDSNKDIDKFKTSLEQWFNETMNRATGWYKKQAQKIIFIIGFVLAVVFNVDTISIVKKLSKDKDARKELADLAASSYKTQYEKGQTAFATADSAKVDSLFNYANNLIKGDINDANTLIGLGWYVPSTSDTCVIPKNAADYDNDRANCKTCLKKVTEGCGNTKLGTYQKLSYVWCMATGSGRKFLGYLITALAISFGAPFWFDLLGKLMQLRGAGKKPEEKESDPAKQPEQKIKRVG